MKPWLRNCLLTVFAAVFLVSAGMLGRYFISSYQEQSAFQELSQMVHSTAPVQPEPEPEGTTVPPETSPYVEVLGPDGTPREILREYAAVYRLNRDLAGWLTVPGTKIDYPVMYAPDRKDHYLYKNYYGQYSSHGCLYIQEEADPFLPSDNLTVYGHNMKDGSMFAGLFAYRDKSFWEKNPLITFNTLTEKHTYRVFAVFTTTASQGEGFAYHSFVNAHREEDFYAYIRDCKNLSLYDTGVKLTYGDKLITLSTCEYSQTNGRLVVVARLEE